MTLHKKSETSLKDEVLTTEILNELDDKGNTVWHIAARYSTLKHISKHLFTEDSINQKNGYGQTVFHLAAAANSLKDIPKHLFTADILNNVDDDGYSVWHYIAQNETITDVPKQLITKDLLNMLNDELVSAFDEDDRSYIFEIAELPERLNSFLQENKPLVKEVELRDPRLRLTDVYDEIVSFDFDGCDAKITLSYEGAFINYVNYGKLSDAVSFIENNYPNIEKSISLPKTNALKVDEFVL